MLSPFIAVALLLTLAVFAGTFRTIKLNLRRRHAHQMRPIAVWIFHGIECLFWLACLLTVIALAPHPLTVVIVCVFVAAIVLASRLRYSEEKRSLNRWLPLAARTNASLPFALECFADGCRSKIAVQAKSCANRLNQGQSIVDAVRRSKLPIAGDTLARFVMPDSNAASVLYSDEQLESESELDNAKSRSVLYQQFSYILATVLLAWGLGVVIRTFVLPTFENVMDEFSRSKSGTTETLETVVLIANVVVALLLVWLFIGWIIRWLPKWIVPLVPWFGGQAINRWRCEILGALERGMRVGQADSKILQLASQTTRSAWIRSKCSRAIQVIDGGESLPNALRKGSLISSRERVWFQSAAKNDNLPDAIGKLKQDIERQQTYRWQVRMAWLVPLVTVLVGGFVLAHAFFAFELLTGFVRRFA